MRSNVLGATYTKVLSAYSAIYYATATALFISGFKYRNAAILCVSNINTYKYKEKVL